MGSFSTGDIIALGSLCVAAVAWSVQGLFHAWSAAKRTAAADAVAKEIQDGLKARLDQVVVGFDGLSGRFHTYEIEQAEFRARVTGSLETLARRHPTPEPTVRRRRIITPSEARSTP